MRPLRLFWAAAVVEVFAVGIGWAPLQWVSKPLLAPLLAWYLIAWARPGLISLAWGFAAAGDIALLVPGRTAFLIGMAFFLGTQINLCTAFFRYARPPRPALIGYGVLWLAANALLWSRLGPLRIPVLVYSLALVAMAATAAGVNRSVATGGAIFLASDLMIGLRLPPAFALPIMITYVLALYLITTGWAARHSPARPVPSPALSGSTPAVPR